MEYAALIFVLILLAGKVYFNEKELEELKREHKEIQEEKKLEKIRERLWDNYKIQCFESMSWKYYNILQINKEGSTYFDKYYTLAELEQVVATIKSFSL